MSNPDQAIADLISAIEARFPEPLDRSGSSVSTGPLEALTDEALDVAALVDFRNSLRPDAASALPHALDDETFLWRLGLMQDGRLTLAGALLFGVAPSRVAPNSVLQCAMYQGHDRTSERIIRRFEGNLIDQIRLAMAFVRERSEISEFPVSDQPEAVSHFGFPMIAIRELLANAVVHRDYTNKDAIVHLRIFSDRLEIVSPGRWVSRDLEEPVDARRPIRDLVGESVKRNLRIAHALSMVKLFEGEGSGIPTALGDCRQEGVAEPTVGVVDGFVSVQIYRKKPAQRPGHPRALSRRTISLRSLTNSTSCCALSRNETIWASQMSFAERCQC